MRIGKLDLVILAAVIGGVFWVEHSHRIKIEMSTLPEVAGRDAVVCPENESVPFSADCMMFIQGRATPDLAQRPKASDGVLAESPELP